jgi:hypothetical protein
MATGSGGVAAAQSCAVPNALGITVVNGNGVTTALCTLVRPRSEQGFCFPEDKSVIDFPRFFFAIRISDNGSQQ